MFHHFNLPVVSGYKNAFKFIFLIFLNRCSIKFYTLTTSNQVNNKLPSVFGNQNVFEFIFLLFFNRCCITFLNPEIECLSELPLFLPITFLF